MRATSLTTALAIGLVISVAQAFAGGTVENTLFSGGSGRVGIVAAENFYGDIASQIAGPYATVRSILADPNIDPHQYESDVNDAKSIAVASLVIENGGGYDSWMDRLLAASPQPKRLVIKGYEVAPLKLPDNVHVWYSPKNAEAIAAKIAADLASIDPAHAQQFDHNLTLFSESLAPITAKMNEISAQYAGTPIALTETIFQYQSVPMALKVITPFSFQKAIAEGNDPPASSILAAENQIRNREVKLLIYNEQTVDKITTSMQQDAKAAGIPVVPVTETMPRNRHYQSWMMSQLAAVEAALSGRTTGTGTTAQ
ncbi:MAG TPA: zinc ABC transporter substrate-binding protein [Spirochaetia bacterium]|nr:zinc ABC transporter substrate-binding protein [Spirochaetia bacterium]